MLKCPSTIREYEVIEMIGEGGFAMVYKVIFIPSSDNFAMKVISKSVVAQSDDKDRLQREIDTMADLDHENVIKLHDFFEDDEYYYLIMDYCAGGDLFEYISNSARVKEVQAATVFQQIISAIQYCHSQGVAHRDLKPQNILITVFPNIKVCDFGLCQYFEGANAKMKTACGSPFYASPECIKGKPYNGRQSDIWSLGVILYELVTKQHPWPFDNTGLMLKRIQAAKFSIPDDVSPPCQELIRGMMKLNPNERLKPEQILKHSWMKLATSRHRKPYKLPRLASENNMLALRMHQMITSSNSAQIPQVSLDSSTPKSDIVSPFSRARDHAKLQRFSSNEKMNQFEKCLTLSKSPRQNIDCSKTLNRRPKSVRLAPL